MARLSPAPNQPEPHPDFGLSRRDAALEPLVREQAGRLYWETVKSYGYHAAKNDQGAARIVLHYLQRFLQDYPDTEVHLLAHSAGSVFLAPLVQYMTTPADEKVGPGPMSGRTGAGVPLASCTLWAPAIRTDLFAQTYRPAIDSGMIGHFALYTLTDTAERSDCCVGPYSKSLLYLISNALEDISHVPVRRPYGQPLLGMERFVRADSGLQALFARPNADWILSPNDHPIFTPNAARSQSHVRFEEPVTFASTLERILRKA